MIRPLVKRHGGKWYLKDRIIPLIPEHSKYIETCVGGGSVFLNKGRCHTEIINDRYEPLARLWRELPDIENVEYNEETFRNATTDTPLAYLIRCRMSRGGLGKNFAIGARERGGRPGDVNAWETFKKEIVKIRERMEGVQVLCMDAVALVQSYGPNTFIYIDPPYLSETRTARKCYEIEPDETWHHRLLQRCLESDSMIAISGYRCRLYDLMLRNWKRYDWVMPNHAGQGNTKETRVESLWLGLKSKRNASS